MEIIDPSPVDDIRTLDLAHLEMQLGVEQKRRFKEGEYGHSDRFMYGLCGDIALIRYRFRLPRAVQPGPFVFPLEAKAMRLVPF